MKYRQSVFVLALLSALILGFAATGAAALLGMGDPTPGIPFGFPKMNFDVAGSSTTYNATTQILTVNAQPTSMQVISGGLPVTVTPPRSFVITVKVDNNGNLIGGNPSG